MFKSLYVLCLVIVVMGVFAFTLKANFFTDADLGRVESIASYKPSIVSTLYDVNGDVIFEFYKEKRILASIKEVPQVLINAFVAAEDKNFFEHIGIDAGGVARAFSINLKKGYIKQGGSTITQQLTRQILELPKEKTYSRKLKEAALAYMMETRYSKDKILELYLNQIYLGHGSYGVIAAAENYFGKSLSELNTAESAFIAGLAQLPSRYAKNIPLAKKRMEYVLKQMFSNDFITENEHKNALDTKLNIKEKPTWQLDHYTEHVRRYIVKKYGSEALYSGGLKIYTAFNPEIQKKAEDSIEEGLNEFEEINGAKVIGSILTVNDYQQFLIETETELATTPIKKGKILRGIIAAIDDELIAVLLNNSQIAIIERKNIKLKDEIEKVFKPYDLIEVEISDDKQISPNVWHAVLAKELKVQAALLCVEAKSNRVLAMVGGRNFQESEFNRATQAKRQLGSTFKPIVYGAALENGFSLNDKLVDSVFKYSGNWAPKNYNRRSSGKEIRLDSAMALSKNTIPPQIAKKIGLPPIIDLARRVGISSKMSKHDLSISLGSVNGSLLEAVRAYTVFANEGNYKDLVFVERVEDHEGNILENKLKSEPKKVLSKNIAFLMTSMLRAVISYGTGVPINIPEKYIVGKTGTTDNNVDAWFIGYSCKPNWKEVKQKETDNAQIGTLTINKPKVEKEKPKKILTRYNADLIIGVWVGNDDNTPLGEKGTGSKLAGPIWKHFLEKI